MAEGSGPAPPPNPPHLHRPSGTLRPVDSISQLFDNNRRWSRRVREQDPGFFPELSRRQSPEYLWIGCSDSRVPANQVVGLLPGDVFVHRNVANVVVHADLNCLSVLQFAVDVLRVRHVIVCGHYGCGGVLAAMRGDKLGLVDNWLRHVQDVRNKFLSELAGLPDDVARHRRLCELNVVEQVVNVCQTTVLQDAWARGHSVSVHGWIYGLEDGLLRDVGLTVTQADELAGNYQAAVANLALVAPVR
ncbi:MAG: carbonate dehydratase [Planctomycetaceae bacterium]|nr:carbonate dehydratase [Planctomycetaceae bacterium]